MDFFAFFLLVAQPFFEASDLAAAVFFFDDDVVGFFAVVLLAAVFLVAFFEVAIFYANQDIVYDYDVTKNIGNENKRNVSHNGTMIINLCQFLTHSKVVA